jgi:hypothetical protein
MPAEIMMMTTIMETVVELIQNKKPVQKNVGSGFSTNINCAQNLISSVGAVCFDPTVNATDDG